MRVYLSGPHGAGKSTIINELGKLNGFLIYPERLVMAKSDEPLLRQKAKAVKHLHEYCDQLDFEKENPEKIILCDRCIYDGVVYSRAFEKIGWINKEQLDETLKIMELMHEAKPEYLVIINPPLESIITNLNKRWNSGEKKWREQDLSYLQSVCNEFKEIKKEFIGKKLIYVDSEQPLEEKVNYISYGINRIIKDLEYVNIEKNERKEAQKSF